MNRERAIDTAVAHFAALMRGKVRQESFKAARHSQAAEHLGTALHQIEGNDVATAVLRTALDTRCYKAGECNKRRKAYQEYVDALTLPGTLGEE